MTRDEQVKVTRIFPSNFFEGLTEPPLVMRVGETFEVVETEKSSQWPAFLLVVNQKGERGWVPERYLSRDGVKANAIQEYDTTTLTPAMGETLIVLEEDLESGWLWCRDSSLREGWFPISHVETV